MDQIIFNDELVITICALGIVLFLIIILLVFSLRASGRAAKATEQLVNQMLTMGDGLKAMNESQHVLKGGLDSLESVQSQAMQTMQSRLGHVQQQMQDKLHEGAMKNARALAELQERLKDTLQGSSEKTTKSLTQLQERLVTIDKAQMNIEKL